MCGEKYLTVTDILWNKLCSWFIIGKSVKVNILMSDQKKDGWKLDKLGRSNTNMTNVHRSMKRDANDKIVAIGVNDGDKS